MPCSSQGMAAGEHDKPCHTIMPLRPLGPHPVEGYGNGLGMATGWTDCVAGAKAFATTPPNPLAVDSLQMGQTLAMALFPPIASVNGSNALQIGQALAIHSHGLFRATPHCVRGCAPSSATAGISRNTFAVFMQPDVAEPLGAPLEAASSLPIPSGPLNLRPTHSKPGLSSTGAAAVGSRRWELKGAAQGSDVRVLAADQGVWREGMSFGEFAELTMKAYYQQPASEPLRAGASVSMYVMHE